MKTSLPQLERWKSRVRELIGNGLDEKAAIRSAIVENIPRYVEMLRECNYSDAMVIDNLKRHGL